MFNVINHRDNWKRVGLDFEIFGPGPGSLTIGISDSDLSKTVTADGTSKMYLWGQNSIGLNNSGVAGGKMAFFHFSSISETAVVDFKYSASMEAIQEGTFYVEGSYNTTTARTGSIALGRMEIVLLREADENDKVSIGFGRTSSPTNDLMSAIGNISGNTVISAPSINTNGLENDPFINNKLVKAGIRIKSGDTKIYINGTEAASSISTWTLADLNKIVLNNTTRGGGRVKTVAVFREPLSDAELAIITS